MITSTLHKKLRLPPYASEAYFLHEMGVQPYNSIYVYAGKDAWRKSRAFRDTKIVICLPIGANPANYFWPVKECSVILGNTGGLSEFDIAETAYYLLKHNAKIVIATTLDRVICCYRRHAA